MKRALLLLIACAACAAPEAPPSPLASAFAVELERNAPLPGPLAALGDRHVLFVGGFLNEEELRRLSARVFYARSYEPRLIRVPGELLLTHAYLSFFGDGQNDGLLLAADMKLDGFGVDLGPVLADHASLTVSGLLSTSSREEREAFTRALFRAVSDRLDPR